MMILNNFSIFADLESQFIHHILDLDCFKTYRQELPSLSDIKEKRYSAHAREWIDSLVKEADSVASKSNDSWTEKYRSLKIDKDNVLRECVRQNLPLVAYWTRKWCKRGTTSIDYEEYYQEGSIGLIQAVLRFNQELGYKFSTYASWWIRQAIGRYQENNISTIRIPTNICDKLSQIKKESHKSFSENGGENIEEIIKSKNLNNRILEASRIRIKSFDDKISFNSEITVGDLLVSHDSEPDNSYESTEKSAVISEILKFLSQKEQLVLTHRYGLNGKEPCTLEEIGGILDLSRERIRQIETDCFRKIKSRARHYGNLMVKEYFGDTDGN